MAKNIRRMLAMVLTVCMFVSVLPMQSLAADDDVVTVETETTTENGMTTEVTTTTTVTNSDGTPTITVEVIESTTTGSTGPDTSVEITENSSTTTVTHKDENGEVVEEEVVHSKEETRTDTTTVTDSSITHSYEVDGSEMTKENMPLPEGGVSVQVPIEEGKENSVSFGGAEGSETVTGDVEEGEGYTKTESTTTTVVEEGKVTVTNTGVTVEETFQNDKTELDLTNSETNPTDTNDLVHVGAAPEEFLPGYEGEMDPPVVPGEYDYVYVGSGNTSMLVPAVAFTTPMSDEDKLAQYGDNAYIKKNSITYYYVGWLPEEVKSTIAKDENNNYVTDEEGYILDVNGNRILKEERTAVGPNNETVYLHRFDNYGSSLSVEGWYDSEAGEWEKPLNGEDAYTAIWAGPQQFILVDAEGNTVTTYCADFATPTQDDYAYNMVNLEEATYYSEAEAEMIRSIASNGYWGTLEGPGSLAEMKERLLATGDFTEAELASLTDGVALTATQMAIWSQSNKMSGIEFVNSHYSNWGPGNVPEDKEDEVLLMFKVYDYLINLEPTKLKGTTADTLINVENFVEDVSVTVIDMDKDHANNQDHDSENDVYTTKVSFSLVVAPSGNSNDDLVAYLLDADGNELAHGRIAGEGPPEDFLPVDDNGNYYFDNVSMTEGGQHFQLNLSGVQYLEEGVYLYTSEISDDDVSSQTMVGHGSGYRGVDVTMDIQFDLEVEGLVVTERVWHEEGDPTITVLPPEEEPEPDPDPVDPQPTPQVFRLNNQTDPVVEIPEEPVPLAAPVVTGDNSNMWIAVMLLSVFAMVAINLFDKKRQHNDF